MGIKIDLDLVKDLQAAFSSLVSSNKFSELISDYATASMEYIAKVDEGKPKELKIPFIFVLEFDTETQASLSGASFKGVLKKEYSSEW